MICLLGSVLALNGCGGSGGSSDSNGGQPPFTVTSVTVTPETGQLRTGDTLSFTSTVQGTGAFTQQVTWSVDGISGGDATHGTISSTTIGSATYTAPATAPSPSAVTITATSTKDPTKSGSATATVYSVVITPANPSVAYTLTQQFTAQVTGVNNPTVQWSASYGSITQTGLYTAPTMVLGNVSSDTVYATVSGGGSAATTGVTFTIPTAVLTSITPSAGIAYQQVTLNGEALIGPTQVFFSGPNGTVIPAYGFQQVSLTEITAGVPSGAENGPVYVALTPAQGVNQNSSSVQFTRQPNLLVHAPSKDLSSGETMQLAWSLLGAASPTKVTWTTTLGTISTGGLFQAPTVTAESYATVTGCLQNTQSCNSLLLRILPFRITPSAPVVDLGQTIQLDALQGGSTLSPQWSVLAGGGTINSGGLYTAPTSASQAGPIAIGATSGTNVQQTSVAVEGGTTGLVNRIYDYINFNSIPNPVPEGTSVASVAVNGNRAYALTLGSPFEHVPAYAAIDVYDVTNPDQPVWLNAIDAASNFPDELFIKGNNLIDVGYTQIAVYSLQGTLPVLTGVFQIGTENAFKETFNAGVVYVLPLFNVGTAPIPVDLYNVTTGIPVHSHYDLPAPPNDQPAAMANVTGVDNTVYVSWINNVEITPYFTIATYDISTTPPTLVNSFLTTNGFELQVANQLLFADGLIFDISNVAPQQVATLPLGKVWGVQGNQVLATAIIGDNVPGANYAVVDVSNPASPVITNNITDLPAWDVFVNSTAAWAGAGRFYSTDGTGGFTVYNVAVPGGWSAETTTGVLEWTYDQALSQSTLYAAGVFANGGGLQTYDVSGGAPNPLGSLSYPNDTGFAVQASGTNVFLGLADSLKTVDVSDPSNPVETASVPIGINALALSGTTLYAGTADGNLVVLDVSNPTAPKTLATVAMSQPMTMRVLGTLLYVAAGPAGMLIFDVSNPAAPAMVSQFSVSGGAPVWDVSPQGSFAVLAADSAGLVTVDVSNPAQPQLISQQALPLLNAFPVPSTIAGILPAFSLALQNGITYLGTSAGLEFAFDASTPAYPRLISLNIVGGDDLAVVEVITPGTNNLYLAIDEIGNTYLLQLENSLPQNSIELYYPPAALSNPAAIEPGIKAGGPKSNLKLKPMRRPLPAGSDGPDRFGFSRTGR